MSLSVGSSFSHSDATDFVRGNYLCYFFEVEASAFGELKKSKSWLQTAVFEMKKVQVNKESDFCFA